MNLENLKREIKKTIEEQIYSIDPSFNIDEAIDIYFKLINYELQTQPIDDLGGLKKTKLQILNKILIERDLTDDSFALVGLYNKNFESYVKKLYYSLDEFGQIKDDLRLDISKKYTFSPVMSKLNKAIPYYEDNEGNSTLNKLDAKKDADKNPIYKKEKGELQYKKLYEKQINLDKYDNPNDSELAREYNNTFLLHYYRAYILRNIESHSSPEFTLKQLLINLESTLISELWITDFLKEKLKFGILQFHGEKLDFNEYIQNSFDLLKQQFTKFVHLSLRPFGKDKSSSEEEDLNEIINKDIVRVRILGEGGSGKTTTLEYLVCRYCEEWLKDNSKKIPVLIYLANVKENESIKESISIKLSTDLSTVDELIESNSIIIFLDGVNEIVKSNEEKKIKLKEIASIINNNEQLDIVITDRYELDTTQNDPFNISTYSIQKLNENQIERFVINYSLNSGHSPEKILKVIQSKPNLKELLLKPLLLSRAIEIIKIENTLPEKESLIIERFIDLMLEREKNEKMDPMLKISEFKLLMGYAANYIFLEFKSNSSINESKFQKILIQGSKDLGFESFNAGYSLRMGFELEILSRKDDLLQFYHQSFFEFFVSYYFTFEES